MAAYIYEGQPITNPMALTYNSSPTSWTQYSSTTELVQGINGANGQIWPPREYMVLNTTAE